MNRPATRRGGGVGVWRTVHCRGLHHAWATAGAWLMNGRFSHVLGEGDGSVGEGSLGEGLPCEGSIGEGSVGEGCIGEGSCR